MSSPALSGLVLALAAASCYGLNIVTTRIAAFAGVSGVAIVFYRVFLMLALVGLVAAWRGAALRVEPGERGALLFLAAGTVGTGICYLSSVAFVPVAVAAVVFYTFPVLIVLASPFVEGTRLRPALLGIAGLALLGVALVVGPGFGGLDPRGLLLAAGASVSATVQFFGAARCRRTGLLPKILWVHVAVLPATALVGLATATLVAPADLMLAPIAVAITVGTYLFGFAFQLAALARSSAVVAGIAFCAEPVVAAASAALILGEGLGPVQILGGALVLAAITANVILQRPSET
ncbi:MAG TPA: DMT family transporter, partial [Beijerinckiaceae bacterium]|nr:DMT family transporter [Beijerinckiaceae bacterium]